MRSLLRKVFFTKLPTWVVAVSLLLAVAAPASAHFGIYQWMPKLDIVGGTLTLTSGGGLVSSSTGGTIDISNSPVTLPATVTLGTSQISTALTNKIADYTVTNTDCGKTFTNEGAAGANVKFLLPSATTYPGCKLTFVQVATGNLVINTASATSRIRPYTSSDQYFINSTGIGNAVTLLAADTDWHAVANVSGNANGDTNGWTSQ